MATTNSPDVYRAVADHIAIMQGKPYTCQPKRSKRRMRREHAKVRRKMRARAASYWPGEYVRKHRLGTLHNMELKPGVTVTGRIMSDDEMRASYRLPGERLVFVDKPDATLHHRVFGLDYGRTEARSLAHFYEEAAVYDPKNLTKLSKQMQVYIEGALRHGSIDASSETATDDRRTHGDT